MYVSLVLLAWRFVYRSLLVLMTIHSLYIHQIPLREECDGQMRELARIRITLTEERYVIMKEWKFEELVDTGVLDSRSHSSDCNVVAWRFRGTVRER